jgi:transcriptional regulator with XRE-family HTH domain
MKNTDSSNKEASAWAIIEKIRDERGIPKKTLAERLGINYSYLVDLLNGRYTSKIDSHKIQILSDVFRISTNKLLKFLNAKNNMANIPDFLGDTRPDVTSGQAEAVIYSKPELQNPELPAAFPVASRINLIRHKSEAVITPASKLMGFPQSFPNTEEYSLKCTNNPDIIAIKLDDDSMHPPFPVGTIFFVDTRRKAALKNLVFTIIQDGRSWFREWYYTLDTKEIILKAYNPGYDYIQILIEDIVKMYPMVGMEINP